MKNPFQLLILLLGTTVCLAPTALAEQENTKPSKRPMEEFRRGYSDGKHLPRGKGSKHRRGPRLDGHLMKRIHYAADKNKDGKLNEQEREEFKRLVGEAKRRMHQEILARYDEDGDGKLSEQERAKARAAGRKKMEKLRKEAIERFDKNGDGKLDEEERQQARQAVRQRMMERTKEFDANGDGVLDDTERAAARETVAKERGKEAPPHRKPGFRPKPESDRNSPQSQEGGSKREELRQRFDTDKDGTLDDSERQTMRETIRKERANSAE